MEINNNNNNKNNNKITENCELSSSSSSSSEFDRENKSQRLFAGHVILEIISLLELVLVTILQIYLLALSEAQIFICFLVFSIFFYHQVWWLYPKKENLQLPMNNAINNLINNIQNKNENADRNAIIFSIILWVLCFSSLSCILSKFSPGILNPLLDAWSFDEICWRLEEVLAEESYFIVHIFFEVSSLLLTLFLIYKINFFNTMMAVITVRLFMFWLLNYLGISRKILMITSFPFFTFLLSAHSSYLNILIYFLLSFFLWFIISYIYEYWISVDIVDENNKVKQSPQGGGDSTNQTQNNTRHNDCKNISNNQSNEVSFNFSFSTIGEDSFRQRIKKNQNQNSSPSIFLKKKKVNLNNLEKIFIEKTNKMEKNESEEKQDENVTKKNPRSRQIIPFMSCITNLNKANTQWKRKRKEGGLQKKNLCQKIIKKRIKDFDYDCFSYNFRRETCL